MTELRSLVSGTSESVANLEWYPDGHAWAGNLAKVISPLNHLNQRYYVEYEYDGVIAAHVTKTTDVHGYVSEAQYDYALGENVWTKDVNGQETSREFDGFGRLWRVAAPGFTLSNPTIEIAYSPTAAVPRALTKNKLPGGGTLDTVVLMDGIGRVIQTKKTAEVWSGSEESTAVGWAVTGHQLFDVMGRVAEQGQTFFEANLSTAYSPGTPKNPTRLLYDVLGRTFQTVEPNGAVTRLRFGFGTPAGTAIVRHQTTAVDALGKVRVTYQDAAERTAAVEEHIEGRTPTTLYAYDRLGQLVTVTDAAGNQTKVEYDLLGRRTKLDNRDTGITVFGFDLAGNQVSRQDARNVVTTYVYDFERLKEIHYPTARRNVTYDYGAPGAVENAAGRITTVTDDVGTETLGYDVLGNMARSTRTIDPLRPGDRTRTYTTTFQFDVYGRMLSMLYPDGETLRYAYDAGGLLKSAQGARPATKWDPAQTETYLAKLLYDEFGQRRYERVGNGVVTKFAYDPLTRRLSWLHAQKPGERLLQNLVYSHDLVGNVLGVKNALGEPVPPHAGTVEFEYRYDDLHRLTYAHGEAKSRPRTTDTFTSTFRYSDIHNMLSNVQVHHVLHGDSGGGEYPPQTNHDFAYQYTGAGPHQATRIGDTSLVYDEDGNTLRECRDPADPTCTQRPSHLRRYLWTEENRLDAVIDGGGLNVTKFFYDADGQRIAKLGRGGESITIGQFWALKGRRAATKHIFAGTARVASKLLPPPGWDDTPPPAIEPVSATTVAETGCNPSNYQPQKCTVLPGGDPVLNDYYADAKVRPETYYYHQDHLGSTSWVTDQNARVHEHVEYFPYGEVWRDPRSDIGASPVKGQRFLFTGKELDEETGLYYFGARYYDPAHARWTTRDNRLDGAFDPRALNLYAYVGWNPIVYTDPTGGFKLWVWNNQIHEAITRDAARRADHPYTSGLEAGVRYPDMPEGLRGIARNIDTPGALTYRSHHGDLQFWHSMATGTEKTNQEVLDKIIGQVREWWNQGVNERSDPLLGRLLHPIQDSYSGSHVVRDEAGRVLYFENYNEQDAHAHGEADTGRDWRKIPGAFNAATASEVIIGMYDRKRPFSEVETYLRERVYRFAPGAASSRPGGTAERFRKEPTPEVTIDFGVAP
jgi:RHS repeat-associated protein